MSPEVAEYQKIWKDYIYYLNGRYYLEFKRSFLSMIDPIKDKIIFEKMEMFESSINIAKIRYRKITVYSSQNIHPRPSARFREMIFPPYIVTRFIFDSESDLLMARLAL